MFHMEQACCTKFWETATLSRSGLCSYSQLRLRKRGLVFSSSLYKVRWSSLGFRNQVKNFNLFQTLTRKSKRWECLPEALTEAIYDACEKEAEIGKDNSSDGSLNNKQTVAIEAVGAVSEKGRQILKNTEENGLQPLKWPLWFLGPTLLLATGAIPTLWLPFSSIFSGFNITSLLSLTGLDGLFNMGATLFLLIADYCARPKKGYISYFKIPFSYKFWNFLFNLVGIVVPSVAMAASYNNILQPRVHLLSLATMLGPYLMLLLVQMLAELLTWHWESPVWLIVPVVYEAYRLLQLSRGLELAIDLDAPTWLMEGMKGLVAWWVLVLGIQLMKIAWFVGHQPNRQES